jgi:hypothetical protein
MRSTRPRCFVERRGDHRKSWVYHFVVRLGKNYRSVRTRMKCLVLPDALIVLSYFPLQCCTHSILPNPSLVTGRLGIDSGLIGRATLSQPFFLFFLLT